MDTCSGGKRICRVWLWETAEVGITTSAVGGHALTEAPEGVIGVGLAEMTGTDLGEAVEAKLAVCEARQYRSLANGTLVKEAGAA